MKKITNLIEKLADYQLDQNEAKNIKGGIDNLGDLMNVIQGIGYGGGDPPPFG